jgi:hypothetical protein
VYVASPAIIAAATGFNLHRGCLALAERPAGREMTALVGTNPLLICWHASSMPTTSGRYFGAPRPSAPTPCSSALAVPTPSYRKAIRTSSGAALVVPFAAADPWPEANRPASRRRRGRGRDDP